MTHEEADVIIPQQLVALTDMGCKTINVICGDPDLFVLPAHYFAEESLSASLIMESTSRSRSSIDIGATVAKHSDIVPQLMAAHAVSACDTVGCYHCIVKSKVVKALGAIQVLRNARGGGWVYAKALRSVTRGLGGLRQRYVTSFFLANTAWFTVMSSRPTRISK